jgi:hypothetical protein
VVYFIHVKAEEEKEEEEELRVLVGPCVNEVPHRNVHNTVGVDTRATCPRWRVDFMEGGRIGREGEKNG